MHRRALLASSEGSGSRTEGTSTRLEQEVAASHILYVKYILHPRGTIYLHDHRQDVRLLSRSRDRSASTACPITRRRCIPRYAAQQALPHWLRPATFVVQSRVQPRPPGSSKRRTTRPRSRCAAESARSSGDPQDAPSPHSLPCSTWHPPACLLFFSLAPVTALPTPTAARRTSWSPHPHLTCLPSVVPILSPTVSPSPLPLPLRASALPAAAAGHPPWRAAVPRRPAAGHVGGAGWAACPLGGSPPRSSLLLPRLPLRASNRRHHAPGSRGGNGVVGDGGGCSSGGASRRSTPPRYGRSPLSATATAAAVAVAAATAGVCDASHGCPCRDVGRQG